MRINHQKQLSKLWHILNENLNHQNKVDLKRKRKIYLRRYIETMVEENNKILYAEAINRSNK